MIFILFLVSLGTIHVILASEEKHKRNRITPPAPPAPASTVDRPAVEPVSSAESTESVLCLMQALEEHGHGETPGKQKPKVPTAAKATSGGLLV